jgi:RNA polymerase sigma-70 factor (sigma-E family)
MCRMPAVRALPDAVEATYGPAASSLVSDERKPMTDAYAGLSELMHRRGRDLLAAATLLAGGRTTGEDLLQAALERTMRAWRRIDGDPEAYLRRILYHLAVDGWRLRRRRPELLIEAEPPAQPDSADSIALRHALVQALVQLTPKQRATLVLRFWEQLSEAETAEALGCSPGTVKSTTSRALARLRRIAAPWSSDLDTGVRP